MCVFKKFTPMVLATALVFLQVSSAQQVHIDGATIDLGANVIALVADAAAGGPAGDPIDPAMMAWWKLDETSGATAVDSTGQGNDGTLKGTPAWVKGFKGSALKFSTSKDYVAINKLKYNSNRLPAVTVTLWVRTTNAGDQNLISFDREQYWAIVINGAVAGDGQIAWRVQTDTGAVGAPSAARVDDGNWHHVACLFDNGMLTIYIDGGLNGTATGGRTFGTGVTRYGFLGVASQATTFDGTKVTGAPFAGDMDDVRIYSRALAKTEIEQLAFRGPGNDACENAEAIGEVINLPFDTRQATIDGPGLVIKSPNLWYRYTASATGSTTVSLCGSQFDTLVTVYRGGECNPTRSRLIGSNDDFCGLQSQLTFDATASQVYLIEVGGFDRIVGQGVLSVACEESTPPIVDLGDAPDGSLPNGKRMTAYADGQAGVVQAHFSTVFDDRANQPRGPVHLRPEVVAFLGQTVTLENQADKGADEDTVTNIDPAHDKADQDGGDNGLVVPVQMPQCGWSTVDYSVNVVQPGTDLWVNVWCDFNRDGDWDDTSATDVTMACDSGPVSEWVVQNQYLYGLTAGPHTLTTPAFIAWHHERGPAQMWIRITLSEKPWKGGSNPGKQGNGGSGPVEGYDIGETEDYLITPEVRCLLCEDNNEDGKVDLDDLISLIYEWIDLCSE